MFQTTPTLFKLANTQKILASNADISPGRFRLSKPKIETRNLNSHKSKAEKLVLDDYLKYTNNNSNIQFFKERYTLPKTPQIRTSSQGKLREP